VTTTSRIPSVVDSLFTTFTNAAISGVTVLDGPAAEGHTGTWLALGSTTESDDIEFEQRWAGVGNFQRDEDFTIPCQIRYQSGNRGFKTVRDGAFAVFAAVENILRADPTAGVSGYTVRAEIGGRGRVNQTFQSGGGAWVCVLDFTIHVQTRI
jgi:hypothetical protein